MVGKASSLGVALSVAALVAAEVMPLAGVAVLAVSPSPEHAASASVPRRAVAAVRCRERIRSRLRAPRTSYESSLLWLDSYDVVLSSRVRERSVGSRFVSRALHRATAVLAAAALTLALTACEDDLPASVDPAQVDAVEAPELGACRDLTTDDIAQPSNATRVVDCNDDHTAMTYAVGSLPEELRRRRLRGRRAGGLRLRGRARRRFVKLPGRRREPGDADRPHVGVVPPVGGGLGRGRPLVPLRRRRRWRARPRSCSTSRPT